MTTNVSDVMDLFLSRVDDYRLNAIYTASNEIGLITYLEPYLLDSISDFGICSQDLTYTVCSGSAEGYFAQDLTLENKIVLSRIMKVYWMDKTVNSVLQMSNIIQDHDFKTYSQAQNLDSKRKNLSAIKEEISQILVEYDYKHNNWIEWNNQIY